MNPIDPISADPSGTPGKPVWDASSLGLGGESDASAGSPAPTDAPTPIHLNGVEAVNPALRKRRSGSTPALLAMAALVAVGGVGFAIGHVTSSSSSGSGSGSGTGNFPGNFAPNASGNPGFADGRGLGGAATISGTVVSVGADSITLKLTDGQTITLSTSSSTTYHAQTSSSSSQIAAGQTVQVQTTGGDFRPDANASASPSTSRTATDVTIVSN